MRGRQIARLAKFCLTTCKFAVREACATLRAELYRTTYDRWETRDVSTSYASALVAKRAEVLSEIEQLRQRAAELSSQLNLKENQLRNLDDLLALEDGRMRDSEQWEATLVREKRSASFTDQAAETLESAGKPIHYRQLVSLLAERQVYVPGKDPGANLIAHLTRDSRFARVGRGMYGLASWPSVRTAGKKARGKRAARKRTASKAVRDA